MLLLFLLFATVPGKGNDEEAGNASILNHLLARIDILEQKVAKLQNYYCKSDTLNGNPIHSNRAFIDEEEEDYSKEFILQNKIDEDSKDIKSIRMDSLEEENPSDIKYEFKKISDMLQWNNFRFTRIEKQLMKLMRLRANQRQSTLYNVQEGSGHGGDIDYIYIIDDDFPNGDENEKLKREGLRTGLIHAMSNDIAELTMMINKNMHSIDAAMNHFSEMEEDILKLHYTTKYLNSQLNDSLMNITELFRLTNYQIVEIEKTMAKWIGVADAVKRSHTKIFSALTEQLIKLNSLTSENKQINTKISNLQIDLLNISMQFQQFLSYNLIQNEKSEQMKSELKNCSKILEYHDNKIELIMNEIKQKAENELLNIAQSDIVMNNQHILFLDDEQKDMITRITINEEALDRLQKQLPKDCAESFGKYQEERTLIKPSSVFPSLFCQCDQEWTIIQQRPYGNAIFNRTFEEYRWFFGKISGDHWIGNEYLHALTKSSAQMVRFEAWDLFGDYRVAYYDNFSVANLSHAYRLNIDGYKQQISNLSNSMEFHNGRSFSTPDRDEDTSSKHCARYYSAGWWFSNCMKVNFNGNHELGIVWFDTDRGDWIHLKRTRISIKPSQIE